MTYNTTWSTPDNFFSNCSLDDDEVEYDSYDDVFFASFITIIIFSPVAVAGNAMILAVIWKKTFQRTSFHILLSGLAFPDLCTGLIVQPFICAPFFMYSASRPKFIRNIWTTAHASSVYNLLLSLYLL